MKAAAALLWLLCAASARADQKIALSNPTHAALPNGITLFVQDGALYVEKRDAKAPVPVPEDRPGYRSPVKALSEVTAADNRSWITIKWTDVCGFDDQMQARLNTLYARIENEMGLNLRRGKKVDEAIARFTRAAQVDPDYDAAVLNLARAYLSAGRQQDALDAVEPLIQKNPAKLYIACLADPELAALLSTPRVAGLAISPPGTAAIEAADIMKAGQDFSGGARAAYDAHRRLLAAIERVIEGGGEDDSACPWRSTLHIYDVKNSRPLASLPLVTTKDTAKNKSCLHPGGVPEGQAPAVETRIASANRALSALGFVTPEQRRAAAAAAPISPPENPSIQYTELNFAADGLHLRAYSDGHAELRRGELEVDRAERVERANWAVYLPEARLVAYQWGQFPSEGCQKNVAGGIGVLKP